MALHTLISPVHAFPKYALQGLRTNTARPNNKVTYACSQSTDHIVEPVVIRRSGNYKPNIWDYQSLMSLTSDYMDGTYKTKADQLKEKVRHLLDDDSIGSVGKFDLIDAIQRLGVGYHYKEEIKRALDNVYVNHDQWLNNDLYTTSLQFRLLRQHGYHVSQDVFDKFKNERGKLKMCHSEDAKGILSLYEASYLSLEGEEFMDYAKDFTTTKLIDLQKKANPIVATKIAHSLELPIHWRTTIVEARWYNDIYSSEDNAVSILLDLAKLDFNIAQATYQVELGRLTRWWVDLGLQNMDFSRDRLVENYFWALGTVPEPQFGRAREELAKMGTMITLIDDIYDVYGSLEELVIFTDAVERWEVSAMEKLPFYMKIAYMALLNANNDLSYEMLKEQGFDITSNQKRAWVHLCKAYLVEAKWYYEGYTPTLEEYLENGLISITIPLLLMSCYYLTTEKIINETLDYIESFPSLIYNSAVLVRLVDDLGTSTNEIARGDVPKSIQCYMHEACVSEEVAREHVKHLIDETWKKMNKALLARYPFSETFILSTMNIDRIAQYMYQLGDAHGNPDKESKDRLKSILIEPLPINNILYD